MHILMADDDREDFLILEEAASKANGELKFSYASNWIDLWRHLMKSLPDVLFLDLNMPVKDGFECLRTLKADRKFDSLPIVIFSTSLSKLDIDKAYESHANYFIVKPNSIDDTIRLLEKLMTMDKQTLLTRPGREEFVIV